MFEFIRQKQRARTLARNQLPDDCWNAALRDLPFLSAWTPAMLTRLRELSTLFLVEKNIFSGHESLEVTPHMRTLIAAQACTLLLHRDLDDYAGWTNIIVHPDGFPRTQDYTDEAGVVHTDAEFIAGEAWEDGPVLLSWPDVWETLDFEATGANLVIHEFAHKIDMRNGDVDGVPPLASREAHARWLSAMNEAYGQFCARVDAGEDTIIDPYASEHESEFFAVCAEVYVAAPQVLRSEFPEFFAQMNAFFRLWND
jgi:MtfA peptidase